MSRTLFPALLRVIRPSEPEFTEGYKFIVEQADYDKHLFRTLYRARKFMDTHAMVRITPAQMAGFRRHLR